MAASVQSIDAVSSAFLCCCEALLRRGTAVLEGRKALLHYGMALLCHRWALLHNHSVLLCHSSASLHTGSALQCFCRGLLVRCCSGQHLRRNDNLVLHL
mmetsp:Transcript_72997/g.122301  ORF Transcript_72997/g.122301 Transcript_72997/m.122301 type:complete len:99 (+) Transcript_72997:769-1065(+)